MDSRAISDRCLWPLKGKAVFLGVALYYNNTDIKHSKINCIGRPIQLIIRKTVPQSIFLDGEGVNISVSLGERTFIDSN